MDDQRDEAVMVSFITVKAGVDPERFARFARTADLPTWRGKDVVAAFDTYQLDPQCRESFGADFMEVMAVRSLSEWERVASTDPDIKQLADAFEQLVHEPGVLRLLLRPVERPS